MDDSLETARKIHELINQVERLRLELDQTGPITWEGSVECAVSSLQLRVSKFVVDLYDCSQ